MSQIVRSKKDLKKVIAKLKSTNQSIGLVPTMGALHQGHLSLVQMSKLQYDVTVVSIFVNPTQFNNPTDLDKYPRVENADLAMLSEAECDIVFIPENKDIYHSKPTINLNFGDLETTMEGKHRPGHFNGVGIIVMKLFGLVEPTGAYFGQKDLQQFKVISSLARDFELPLTLHMAPIIRENNGLAMSSRNKRLHRQQVKLASLIYETLNNASTSLKEGTALEVVIAEVEKAFEFQKFIDLEYFEIVQFETLQTISSVNEGDRLALCLAATVAEIRLIDNIIIDI